MAVSITGSPTYHGIGKVTNAGTASSAITVPADCDYILCGVTGFTTTAGFFGSGASITFTKGGADTAMTYIGGTNATSTYGAELFGMVAPDTGTNKTLKYDFSGTGNPGDDSALSLLFLKGVHQTTPTRDVKAASNAVLAGVATASIGASNGDKIIGFAGFFITGGGGVEGSCNTFTNCNLVANMTHTAGQAADACWMEKDATGAQTIGVATTTNVDDGGLVGVALIAAAAAAGPDVWDFVGVSSVVEVTTTSHALVTTGIAGTLQEGDLLVAIIGSRIASATQITLPTGGEWTRGPEQLNNNTLTTSSALPTGLLAWCVRGSSNPNLTFTHPVAPSVALGRIVAYRNVHRGKPLNTSNSVTTGTAVTNVSVAGITTTEDNCLIVIGAIGGQEAAWSSFDSSTWVTRPSGGNVQETADPMNNGFQEREDSLTTTGADMSLAIADAVKVTNGATGNFTCTASVSAGHVILEAAFNLIARDGRQSQLSVASRWAVSRASDW